MRHLRPFLSYPPLAADTLYIGPISILSGRAFVSASEPYMQQEMTFAQALGEARQIIVQQSNRIKSDLEKVVALQNTIAAQSTTISQSERVIREQSTKLSEMEEQVRSLTIKLEEATTACKQADAIIDRQG